MTSFCGAIHAGAAVALCTDVKAALWRGTRLASSPHGEAAVAVLNPAHRRVKGPVGTYGKDAAVLPCRFVLLVFTWVTDKSGSPTRQRAGVWRAWGCELDSGPDVGNILVANKALTPGRDRMSELCRDTTSVHWDQALCTAGHTWCYPTQAVLYSIKPHTKVCSVFDGRLHAANSQEPCIPVLYVGQAERGTHVAGG